MYVYINQAYLVNGKSIIKFSIHHQRNRKIISLKPITQEIRLTAINFFQVLCMMSWRTFIQTILPPP